VDAIIAVRVELDYCGMPQAAEAPPDPAARHGFQLVWWHLDAGDEGPAGMADLPGLTPEPPRT